MFSLYSFWLCAPSCHIFFAEDTTKDTIEEYDGQPYGKELIVTDFRIRKLPNYGEVLVVEVKPLEY